MKLRKVFMAITLLLMLAATLIVTGCNTWHGAGKDVERAGESMQSE
jgi:predicted small secreted protein